MVIGILAAGASHRTVRGIALMLRYIELKSDHNDRGPAWIARVEFSRSGRTVYFNGKALKREVRGGTSGNHYDLETGKEYWVSGIKKDGSDRHWAGGGKVCIEASAVAEYLALTNEPTLDRSRLKVIPDLETPDPSRFVRVENARLQERATEQQDAADRVRAADDARGPCS